MMKTLIKIFFRWLTFEAHMKVAQLTRKIEDLLINKLVHIESGLTTHRMFYFLQYDDLLADGPIHFLLRPQTFVYLDQVLQ